MHYPDSGWRPRCQGKSRDDVSGRILDYFAKFPKHVFWCNPYLTNHFYIVSKNFS